MQEVKFMGNPVSLAGNEIRIGDKAPIVTLVGNELEDVVVGKSERVQIIVTVPSLDTPVCASEARKFNERAASLPNTETIIVSMDLPFAHSRFCTTESIENLRTASDFRAKEFANAYGVLIADGALAGLTTRAVFVIDTLGVIVHKELVAEITNEPDYEQILAIATRVAKDSCNKCACEFE